MRLKFLAGLSVALIASSAFASRPFNGFSLGFQTGVTTANFKYSLAAQEFTGTGVTKTFEVGDHLNAVAPTGRFFLGFGWAFQRFYLGASLAGGLFRLENSNFAENQHLEPAAVSKEVWVRLTLKNNFSADLQPGYLLSPQTLLFTSMGVTLARGELAGVTGRTPSGNNSYLLNKSHSTETGYELGLGISHFISRHMTFTMQYLFDHYGMLQASDRNFRLTNDLKFHSNINTLLMGLAYHFNGRAMSVMHSIMGGFDGFTVGLFGGVLSGLQSSHENDTYLDTREYARNFINNTGSTNLLGGIDVSFAHVFKLLYLGAVLSGQLGNNSNYSVAEFTNSNNGGVYEAVLRTRVQSPLSFDIKPGVVIDGDNVLYVLTGVSMGWIKSDSSYNARSNADLELNDVHNTNHEAGVRIGLGFMTKLTKNMLVGIQDVFTAYSVVHVSGVGRSINNNRIAHSASFVPRTNQVSLHLAYLFSI